jgi:hypothetical protein
MMRRYNQYLMFFLVKVLIRLLWKLKKNKNSKKLESSSTNIISAVRLKIVSGNKKLSVRYNVLRSRIRL